MPAGAISGVFVGDVDGVDAEAELRKLEAAHGALPPTVEAITARGRHVYFKMPPGMDVRNSAGKIAPGIDIRGNGGYVLAPPSIHPSGRPYCWSRCGEQARRRTHLVAEQSHQQQQRQHAGGRMARARQGRARDCSIAKLAGYLLRRQVDPLVALQLLQSWNATYCAPPLSAKDIDRIVNSIAGRELKRRDTA